MPDGDQRGAIDEQAGRAAFLDVDAFQGAQAPGQGDERQAAFARQAGFGDDHLYLRRGRREIELHRDKALARARLQGFEHVLIAGVIGDDEHELVRRDQCFPGSIEWKDAAVIGQRMKHDGDVLARLDNLVEVANAPLADRARQWAVDPNRIAAAQQVAARQISGGQIVMTGNCKKRSFQLRRHVRDKARLAATRWTFEQKWQSPAIGALE